MTIHHIVLLKYKPGVTPEQKQSVRDSGSGFQSKIPAIQSIVTGETLFNPLGHGYDEGVIYIFENVAKLEEYRLHQVHIDHVAFSKPYVEDLIIFDIETADGKL